MMVMVIVIVVVITALLYSIDTYFVGVEVGGAR